MIIAVLDEANPLADVNPDTLEGLAQKFTGNRIQDHVQAALILQRMGIEIDAIKRVIWTLVGEDAHDLACVYVDRAWRLIQDAESGPME